MKDSQFSTQKESASLDEKEKNRKKFEKTGRNRRQDHGTHGNTNHNRWQRWFDRGYFDYGEIGRQELRLIARCGGDEELVTSDEE